MRRNVLFSVCLLAVAIATVQGQATTNSSATSCMDGELRLAGGSGNLTGRVEVCFDDQWGTICDDDWDDNDARVVCRQLGHSAEGARGYGFDETRHDPGTGPIYFDNVACSGDEEYLFDCSASPEEHNCNHFEDAGVQCEEPGFSCEEGELRLLDGKSMYEGRVEVCVNNKFSSICIREWGDEEASVVCNQLGYTTEGTPYATYGGSFGRGVGQISLSGLDCGRNETNLTECSRIPSLFDVFCTHEDDAGVLCPRPDPQCEDGDVRLSGGRTNAEGFVEICLNGHWGTVCHSGWDANDASVVCGELGFTKNDSIAIGFADFGSGEDLILFSEFECTGAESRLFSCPNNGVNDHGCTHSRDAGVICVDANNTCVDGDVRLVDGESENEGRLEICYSNHWGTVCDDNFDAIEAALVCRQLGFEDEGSVGLHAAYFGEGVGLILIDDLECTGNETTLLNCSHRGIGVSNCFHNEDVSVLCQAANSSCVNGDVRLVNGTGAHSGRVEVCFNGRYGTVCDDDWGADDATVVCNQLGYTGEGAIGLGGAFFGQGVGPIYLDNADCSPLNHTTLISCFDTENELGVHNCEHAEDASVICPLGNRTCGDALNGDIRLVGGSTELEGRVEICLDGEWGTICDNFWTPSDAVVACKQLNLGPTDAQSLGGAFFGQGNGSIHLDKFFCSGEEERITDCIHFPAEPGACSHAQDVGVVCSLKPCADGEVRLVNGKIPSEGRVEVCINNQFGTVCDDEWDSLDATVVCRQLGYSDGLGAVALPSAFFGEGNSRIFVDDVRCTGNETDLLSCEHLRDPNFCFHFEDAGVLCQSLNATEICINGDMRLVGGSAEYEGNVEVCFNGNWGTVCEDGWDSADATTVCNILGYSGYALPTRRAYFGLQVDAIIFLDEVQCTGEETNILQCPSVNPGDHDCSHILDAGVVCSVSNSSFECETGDLRLMDGETPNEGRVEMCVNGEWGTICDSRWGNNEAAIVCNNLGFGPEGAQAVGDAFFGEGSGRIYMTNLGCNGTEANLFECPYQGLGGFCRHNDDAGVICNPPPCFDGEIRLVNGQVPTEGNVEVCRNREWGTTVCDNEWDNSDAAVVCRQLGFSGEDAVSTRGAFFGEGTGPIGLTNVACTGNESSLLECTYTSDTSFCRHFEDAGVICPSNDTLNCTTGDVRIRDGSTQYEGRVELCLHGRWGTICDDSWDSRDAAVVCRQLGYSEEAGNNILGVAVPGRRAIFGAGEGFIILDEVNCNGTESSLLECRARELGLHNCRPTEDAAVYCPSPNSTCANGAVQIVGGDSPGRGRVEFCVGGEWRTICADSYWSNEDAQTVCRQLGFESPENAVAIVAGGGSGLIEIIHLDCSGDESRLTDCPVPDFGLISLACGSHDNDAGVICSPDNTNTTCEDGEVRLVDGDFENEGRAEICFDNKWGTICDDRFGFEEAVVICRQLNYTDDLNSSVPIARGFFGRGLSAIHLDELGCFGNESSLLECQHRGVGEHNCQHNEDAGVICVANNPQCAHGDVRLVGGSTEYEGRLEVCLGGRWGTVCNDFWDAPDANVVCRQLGFPDQGAIAEDASIRFEVGDGLILLDDLHCLGTEQRLLDCPSAGAGINNCRHTEDVAVICRSPPCTAGDVRLVGSTRENEGTVELCVDGNWGTVCSEEWHNEDAAVVCNYLGFVGNNSIATSIFGRGSGDLVASGVACLGNETDLLSCRSSSSPSCTIGTDAGVICPPGTPQNCTDGEVRLMGGRNDNEGFVQVCLHGLWGGICPLGTWDSSAASVVCRQLGLTENGSPVSVVNHFDFGFNPLNSLFFLQQVVCTGNESSLFQCSSSQFTNGFCDFRSTVGVFCPYVGSTCQNGDVRLVDKRTEHSGRVEFCVGGEWLSLCGGTFTFWTDDNARAVCSQLGYNLTASDAVANLIEVTTSTPPVFPYEFLCIGNEKELSECVSIEAFLGGECFSEYAAVICQIPVEECTSDDGIRLVDGAAEFEGRVEVCLDGHWGTICDDNWDKAEAQVVCRQLGYSNYEDSIPYRNAFFGQGIVPIHLDEVNCIGNESSLYECGHPGVGIHNCGHHEDAGVLCISDNANCTHGDLRLVDGTSDLSGRVEVCIGGRWGTVCDDLFGALDAQVVCRQLGYNPDTATFSGNALFGPGTGPIFLDQLGCFGNESRLLDCPHRGTGVHSCFHNEDVSVTCTGAPVVTTPALTCVEGSVELRGGSLSTEGTVQFCENGEWGTICDDRWDKAEAEVVCRQLGFEIEGAIGVRGAFFGEGEGPIHYRHIICDGSEESLADCPKFNSIIGCGHHEDSGVICPSTQPGNCTTGDVRIQDGSTQYEGRVELCLHGRWGTICDDSWDSRDAAVVCRQLGYTENGEPWAAYRAGFGEGDGLIILDEVNCNGSEATLLDCRASELGNHNCRPTEDAGVYCPYAGSSCRNGDVRLVGGDFDYEGRPEVCIGGRWGTICSDINWDDKEARTICRQLGYTNVSEAVAYSSAQYGEGTGPIFLGSLNCTGSESNILHCESIGGVRFGCDHSDDAGIQCRAPNVTLCEDGDIQLVGGATENEGRVEICYNNHWGTICDDQWGPEEAIVVCRQLGYGNGSGSVAIGRAYFGEGTGRIHLDNINCERTTIELDQCSHSGVGTHNCGHNEDAGVICLVDNPSCDYGDLQLVGGDSDLEGRVEVCIGGRWGTVCDDLWGVEDASVVCRQLGFSSNEATARNRAFYGQGSGPIFLDQTQCTGNESKLIDCTTSGVAVHNCQHSEDAGVTCQPLPCVENSFRLAGGIDGLTGIPQVCVEEKWGSVCANSFDSNAAMLVCGGLGFERTGARQVPGSLFKALEPDTSSNTYNLTVTCNNGDCSVMPSLATCSEVATGFAGLLCPSKLAAGTPRVCMPGEVRLAGGSDSSEGRVEVCLSNQWGTVCDDSWDDRAAAVVCRQLGLPFEGAYAEVEGKYGPGVGPIYLDDVKCSGMEEHILGCKQPPLGSGHNCDHSEDAMVVCQGATTTASTTAPTTTASTTAPTTPPRIVPSVNTQANTSSQLSIAVIIPLVLIIVVLILILIVVIIIFLVYKARKSGKLTFRTFEDERPIVGSPSFSADVTPNKEGLEMEEKSDKL